MSSNNIYVARLIHHPRNQVLKCNWLGSDICQGRVITFTTFVTVQSVEICRIGVIHSLWKQAHMFNFQENSAFLHMRLSSSKDGQNLEGVVVYRDVAAGAQLHFDDFSIPASSETFQLIGK
ncbi:hypothetical protein A0H81_11946 [Grifola frondosa]|uniref:C2 domain-containing protein n=1 Tax=Grifola frondosa TaxID=5627 RepID=A0A1C7LTL9_GRIFR|nr:hypothetical protein A0H81_11946 [Grifola frondosa]